MTSVRFKEIITSGLISLAMIPLSEKQSKRASYLLTALQVACVLFAGYFGGHAMLFCQPKDTAPDACQKTAEYTWNNNLANGFITVWLVSIIAALLLAFVCSRNQRSFVIGKLLIALPILGYFVFLFMLMAGI